MHNSRSIKNVDKRFTATKRVEFHETDMAGIVHFSNAFRFFEFAESAFFRNGGITVYGWPILTTGCTYIKPMKFDYELEISIAVERIGNKSLRLIFDIEHQVSEDFKELLATGFLSVIHAPAIRPGSDIITERIPEKFRSYLESYLSNSGNNDR